MTLREAVDYGSRELTKAHTRDPEGCAKFLLRHVLEKKGTQSSAISFNALLVAEPDLVLCAEDWKLYKDMLDRRVRHEPVWYITNEAYFWHDAFYVDERVLIPRPETELLVETVLADIRRRIKNRKIVDTRSLSEIERSKIKDSQDTSHNSRLSIIDVGTGSGVIAISLARELSQTSKSTKMTKTPNKSDERSALAPFTIYASDISPDAIEVAKINAQHVGVERFITFCVGDALEPFTEKVDLIVGNPPYIPTETVGGLAYDIHHFEPRVALDGGKDGLDVHRKILKKAEKILQYGGLILLEIGHDQGKMATKIAKEYFPAAEIDIIQDYDGNDRIVRILT